MEITVVAVDDMTIDNTKSAHTLFRYFEKIRYTCSLHDSVLTGIDKQSNSQLLVSQIHFRGRIREEIIIDEHNKQNCESMPDNTTSDI